MSVKKFIINLPGLKLAPSEKKEHIYDEEGRVVARAGRFYKSIWQKIFSYTLSHQAYTNVIVEDADGNPKVKISLTSNPLAFTEYWKLEINTEDKDQEIFTIKRPPKVGITKIFEVEKNGEKLLNIEDRTMGVEPKFYDENKNLLAKCRDEMFKKEVHIDMMDDNLSIYLVGAICYMIYISN